MQLYFQWIEEWSQFLSSCNWYTFHPLGMEFEDERNMGAVELTVIVLGLGFSVRLVHTETDLARRIAENAAAHMLHQAGEKE